MSTSTCRLLLLAWLLGASLQLAGCAASRSSQSVAGSVCPADAGTSFPRQSADGCHTELCEAGRMVLIEDLTVTAPVSDWAEEVFCLLRPLDCYRALSVRKHVRKWEQEMSDKGFWDRSSMQSGLGDAARHAYLSCLLAGEFGEPLAKGLLDAHEEDSSLMFGFGTAANGNRCCDKIMDLHNNRIGLALAREPGGCQEKVMGSLQLLRHSLCGK